MREIEVTREEFPKSINALMEFLGYEPLPPEAFNEGETDYPLDRFYNSPSRRAAVYVDEDVVLYQPDPWGLGCWLGRRKGRPLHSEGILISIKEPAEEGEERGGGAMVEKPVSQKLEDRRDGSLKRGIIEGFKKIKAFFSNFH